MAQADLTTVEMMEGARIVGRLVEAATRREVAVRPVAEVAVRVLADQAADGQTTAEMGTVEDLPLAALEAPETEGAPPPPGITSPGVRSPTTGVHKSTSSSRWP